LRLGGFAGEKQPIPVVYEGIRMDAGFRADPIVANKVIVEIRSAGKRLGSPINLHVVLIQDGITRIVTDSKK